MAGPVRPTYESHQDRVNEIEVATELAVLWRCEAHKMPAFYQVDWALANSGTIRAWVEIKCRKVKRTQYPTLMLSLHKWLHGLKLQSDTGIPFILVVRWDEGIFYMRANSLMKPEIRISGRVDRGDPQDMEPCVHIPIDQFTPIK